MRLLSIIVGICLLAGCTRTTSEPDPVDPVMSPPWPAPTAGLYTDDVIRKLAKFDIEWGFAPFILDIPCLDDSRCTTHLQAHRDPCFGWDRGNPCELESSLSFASRSAIRRSCSFKMRPRHEHSVSRSQAAPTSSSAPVIPPPRKLIRMSANEPTPHNVVPDTACARMDQNQR
jgi:hypothetical protein